MAFKDNEKINYKYNTTDINEATYIRESIFKFILDEININTLIGADTLSEITDEINKINKRENIHRQIIDYQKTYQSIKNDFIEKSLRWINGNINSGFYLWFKLFIIDIERNETIQPRPESLEKIIFDIINFAMSDTDKIDTLKKKIDEIHQEYQNLAGTKRLSWLKDDDNQIRWAYQYLKEKDRQFRRFYFGDPINLLDIIKVYYDLHIDDRGIKLTYIEMNNAWNQHRYRESRKDKKALSGYISSDAKMKLTQMAKNSRMPEYELLELLILEQYGRDNQKN